MNRTERYLFFVALSGYLACVAIMLTELANTR